MGAQKGFRNASAQAAHRQMKLLTETEAAEILKCSATTVKRLRLTGKLTYLEGRPVLIDEVDLQAFIDVEDARKAKKAQPADKSRRVTTAEARLWAQQQMMRWRAPPRSKI